MSKKSAAALGTGPYRRTMASELESLCSSVLRFRLNAQEDLFQEAVMDWVQVATKRMELISAAIASLSEQISIGIGQSKRTGD